MKQALLRWILIGLAVLAVGPFLAMVVGLIDGPAGGPRTAFITSSPIASGLLALIAVGVAGLFGWMAARVSTIGLGLFCAGGATGWLAYHEATTEELIRASQSVAPLWTLTFEAVVFAAVGLVMTVGILGKRGRPSLDEEVIGPQAALGAGVSLLIAAIGAWVLARESTPGQALAATGIASMFAIAAGKSVAPSAALISCVAGVLLVSIIGPAAGATLHGGEIVELAYSNTLFPLARLSPLNWLAGVWMGAPIGVVWAASMLEKKGETVQPMRPRVRASR